MDKADTHHSNGPISFLTGYYIGMILLLIAVWIGGTKDQPLNDFVGIWLTIPLFGALLGFRRLQYSQQPISNSYRIVPTLFCAGLLLWSIGSMIWKYYNFILKEEIPYPSWADLGYGSSAICWTIGLYFIYKIAGTNWFKEGQLLSPFLIAVWGATILLTLLSHGSPAIQIDSQDKIIKLLLDFYYPMVDALNVTLLAVLILGSSFKKLDDSMKRNLLVIMIGLILNFVGDVAFNIATTLNKSSPLAYYNGGWTDYLFVTALYVLSIGVLLFPFSDPPVEFRG